MSNCCFRKYNKLTSGCATSRCLFLTTSTTTSSTTTMTSTSTTSSTTTTTTTAAPTTTTTTTSTTTTSTSTTTTSSTSSTTTTTTTLAPDPLRIFVTNGRSSAIGFNTQVWSDTIPYYTLQGGALLAAQTQTTYNSTFGASNTSVLRYENTGTAGVTVTMYFSDNNGSTYSLLGSANLAAYSGSGPYPFTEQTHTTTRNGIGVTNLIQFLVTNGVYSTSQYIIRVVNNTGFTVDLDVQGRSSPSNLNYFASTNVNIATATTQTLVTSTLLEAATRITMLNNGEEMNVSFYYSNNNGTSYSLVGSAFLGISGTSDNSYATVTPGNNANCILEIRLS